MSKRVVRLCVVAFVASMAMVSLGQKRDPSPHLGGVKPQPVRSPADSDGGKVATAEEPDFTRFRVVTDSGILAAYDARQPSHGGPCGCNAGEAFRCCNRTGRGTARG